MKLLLCVVIPCLNEEHTLADTCQSLGFGADCETEPDSVLILVDNGSEDGTRVVAEQVQNNAPTGTVVIAEEPERGYVPPRRKGNNLAAEIAVERRLPEQAIL